jgi:hypothetical protein
MRALQWIGLLLAVSLPAGAYPISPQTLVAQVQRADLIVLAKTVSLSELPRKNSSDWNRAVAHLEVLETWKGAAPPQLEVPFPASLTCPAPPRYIQGETVLAFLSKHEGKWITVGLSYGTLYPGPDELPVLREAARSILALRAGDAAAHRQLLTGLASRRATRWDGLFELVPEGDDLHNYYRREQPQGNAGQLTQAELAAISSGFISEPSGDQTLTMLLVLLAGYPDTAFDRTVAGVIDSILALEHLPWWFADAYDLALARLAPGRAAPKHDSFTEPEIGVYRQSWQPIRQGLDLGAPVPVIKLPGFGAPGVGRRTPS